jgi:hypothetical protein
MNDYKVHSKKFIFTYNTIILEKDFIKWKDESETPLIDYYSIIYNEFTRKGIEKSRTSILICFNTVFRSKDPEIFNINNESPLITQLKGCSQINFINVNEFHYNFLSKVSIQPSKLREQQYWQIGNMFPIDILKDLGFINFKICRFLP